VVEGDFQSRDYPPHFIYFAIDYDFHQWLRA
jgi:hypothetical protein